LIHYTTKKIVYKNFVWAQAHKSYNMHPSLHLMILTPDKPYQLIMDFRTSNIDLCSNKVYDQSLRHMIGGTYGCTTINRETMVPFDPATFQLFYIFKEKLGQTQYQLSTY
jgi:hypothetical protein